METKKLIKNASQSLIGLLAAVASCSASAVPVTDWAFQVDAGFTAFTPTSGVTGSFNNPVWAAPTKLSWGTSTGSGQSSFSVGSALTPPGQFTGTLLTNGPAVNTVQVIHQNNAITGTTLSSAVLSDRIVLHSTLPLPIGPDLTNFLTFNINYLETPNSPPCAVTSPTPCNDIFVLDVAGAGFNPADNSLNQTFLYDGEDYNAILKIAGLAKLTDAACDAVFGNTSHRGCIGFTTQEGLTNTFQVSLAISDTPFVVPEPASLALVGLALAGLGMRRRRQV